MNKTMKVTVLLMSAGAVLGWSISNTKAAFQPVPLPPGQSTTYLPSDAYPSCTLTASKFNSWFKSGKAVEKGGVTPANSVTFPHKNNCDFYQWSEQMFLWATSPSAGLYGSKGIVLESPLFYDVLPEDPITYRRKLVPHDPGHIFAMSNHLVKNGPHRLPVVRSKSGELFEIGEPLDLRNGKLLVKNTTGNIEQVADIQKKESGNVVFLNKSGGTIPGPKPLTRSNGSSNKILHPYTGKKGTIFLTENFIPVETEEGQATGNVLMSQNGSIVYYLTMVNDVYAYYLTGAKSGVLERDSFPTDAADRDKITAFARSMNKILPDSNALAMEIKSSWVEASTVKNVKDYITVTARIPVYQKKSNKLWVPYQDSTKKVLMALIGMHVVGSVNGHPEMVWATFEHQSNSPDAAYAYINTKKQEVQVPAEKGMYWQLSNNSSNSNYNIPRMISNPIQPSGGGFDSFAYGGIIYGDTATATTPAQTIGPSHTQRIMAWGSAYDSVPNPEDSNTAAANTEVISLNSTIQKLLPGNDARKSYLLIGATWTLGGVAPNGSSYSSSNTAPGAAIGTSVLANSTMETYFQGAATSCFACHSAGQGVPVNNKPDTLSHMFTTITALNSFAKRQPPPR